MNGEIIYEAEMRKAGEHAETVKRLGIEYGIEAELNEVYGFLLGLQWKGMH